MTGTELLPCPFCGTRLDDPNYPPSEILGGGTTVECGKCRATWPVLTKEIAEDLGSETAVIDWFNRRSDLCASGQQVRALEVDDLAQIIRVVDGNNTLGAGELAEAILEAMPVPRIVGALTPAPQPEGHPDDLAVDRFATAMKAKLAKKRAEGRSGWDRKDECSAEDLTYMLVQHIWKGDPLDVGNLAMMLHQRGERIVIDSETRSIAQTADWRDDPAVAAAFGVDFTAHPPERGRDVQETRVATREETLAGEILAELTRARAKFPGKNVTFAALVEEVGELATATFEEGADRVRKEAVQVAVMAMRMILEGDHCYEPWRAEKGLDPLDPELRAQAEGRDNG
ncbi:hypothetical protein LO749_09310 [Paracoccus denitrificans]|uniref:hypothetical protein n=1 Tax=Paracoccus denitrificans TaxID=266 RepID=UPI001E5A6CAE|nr:hypothetical protein [Paracoccus denitrificans]UFS64365.1 hypothetical protein LO749_09310 [Paracoccus denitrificans]